MKKIWEWFWELSWVRKILVIFGLLILFDNINMPGDMPEGVSYTIHSFYDDADNDLLSLGETIAAYWGWIFRHGIVVLAMIGVAAVVIYKRPKFNTITQEMENLPSLDKKNTTNH